MGENRLFKRAALTALVALVGFGGGCRAISGTITTPAGATRDTAVFCAVDGGYVQVNAQSPTSAISVAFVPNGGAVGTYASFNSKGVAPMLTKLKAGACGRVRVRNTGKTAFTSRIDVYFDLPDPTTMPPPPPPTSCAMTHAAGASCWETHTGVGSAAGNAYTTEQSEAGANPKLTKTYNGDIIVMPDGAHLGSSTGTRIASPNADGSITLANAIVNGCIGVRADNVTLSNLLVHTHNRCAGGSTANPSGAGNYAAVSTGGTYNPDGRNWLPAKNAKLVSVTIDGFVNGYGVNNDSVGLSGENWNAEKINIRGFAKNIYLGANDFLSDSYIHDVTNTQSAATANHLDSVFADSSSNFTLNHNWIGVGKGPSDFTTGGGITGALGIINNGGKPKNVKVTGNYLEGNSGVDMQGGAGPSKTCAPGCYYTYMVVTGNYFSDNASRWNNGPSQKIVNFDPTGPGNVFTNNKLAEDPSKTVNADNSVTP